ncbi:hypothetical protein [Enterocloster clostridioformis]|uniref:hypothetical protein n=1 Tax=Enterocloster clostridioformis TaxID=1531 RepID=UPI001A98C8D9|nr:hypothetical protein [Enterocloster clostridioformis]NSJ37754.1 hypothetical protein [Enterocloster clostridioformis]
MKRQVSQSRKFSRTRARGSVFINPWCSPTRSVMKYSWVELSEIGLKLGFISDGKGKD